MRIRILPIFLITVGLGFLLANLGVLPAADVREFFRTWWPVFLIAFGAVMLLRPYGSCRERFERRHRTERGSEPGVTAEPT
jgi:Domain of unknown function (DUF5668)